MTETQYRFGEERLNELSLELGVSCDTLVICLRRIERLKSFYDWVNADEFLDNIALNESEDKND